MDAKHNAISVTCPSDMTWTALVFKSFPQDAYYQVTLLKDDRYINSGVLRNGEVRAQNGTPLCTPAFERAIIAKVRE